MPRPDIYLDGIRTQFRAMDAPGKLADNPIAVRLPAEIDRQIRLRPDRAPWLRRAIVAALRQGLPDQEIAAGKLAAAPISVRLPIDIDRRVRQLPNMQSWLRRAIAAALQKDRQSRSD